jgi:glyoxylase-like metal-dependent hydrolase (beta-lactamase superfamily II)
MKLHLDSQDNAIYTLDLNFMGRQGAIAAYLIPHKNGAALVECGPGSTISTLLSNLHSHGYAVSDISDVLVTHIHLDHAGASGWLARQGATIHVHPVGAPHLLNPKKLLTSARRIYGNAMETLWGEFLPVPEKQLVIHQDQELIEIEGLEFRPLETPGHATHHFAYLLDGVCFSGDIAGVRVPGVHHIRLPMAPPEFHLESWRQSLEKLRQEKITHILPTHFGIFPDPDWHLNAVSEALENIEQWMSEIMPLELPLEELETEFLQLENKRALASGVDPNLLDIYETANPPWISLLGIQRYWRKYRQGD